MLKSLLEKIVREIVDDVDAIDINVIEGQRSTVIELKVAPEDVGKVIGRGGNTAKAIRTILNAASRKLNKRTILEILE